MVRGPSTFYTLGSCKCRDTVDIYNTIRAGKQDFKILYLLESMVGFVLSICRGFKDLYILFVPILKAKFAILAGTCTFFDIIIFHGMIFLDNGTADNI